MTDKPTGSPVPAEVVLERIKRARRAMNNLAFALAYLRLDDRESENDVEDAIVMLNKLAALVSDRAKVSRP